MSLNSVQPCCRFSLADIETATRSFDDELVIGHGGFGKVYKGCISKNKTSHNIMAFKRLDSMSGQGAPEFQAEIEMISMLRHCHLVSLIGFCDDNKEMILVYDYMPNGTLHDRLHKVDTPLSWVQRLKIAIGAARGLDYLHTGVGTQHGVIHRDVKSSNILLDDKWGAKISDFGLSKIGPTNQSSSYVDASVKGTFGYLDPEYFYTRRLTRKTDVYSFGVVLFELLSGSLPVDERYSEEQCSLVRWAQKCVKERKLDQLVDSKIRGTIFPKCLRLFVQIAYRCLLSVPKERPTMTEVVAALQGLLELQNKHDLSSELPGKMGFTWKIHKYLVSAPKQNSDDCGTSSPKSLENNMNQHEELVTGDVKAFTYDELKRATSGFSNDTRLGVDIYGKIYKGWVDKTTCSICRPNKLPVVVKKLHRFKHFDMEVLKRFRHSNHVELLGYCFKGKQLLLVYEFMHKGHFEDLLRNGTVEKLTLETKVKIALGIARGIKFLYTSNALGSKWWELGVGESSGSLLQRRKILLDEEFTAKISDYDISILVHGDYPRVLERGDYSYPGLEPIEIWSNFWGFEVVFAEVLSGEKIHNLNGLGNVKRFFNHCGNKSLTQIARFCYENCEDVDAESKMLAFLKKYDDLIQTRRLNGGMVGMEAPRAF